LKTFELIMAIVNRGRAEDVMRSAKRAGATGGTVVYARGTGIHETELNFGVLIQPEKELVLILAEQGQTPPILEAIRQGAGLDRPGQGMCFSLPVDAVAGARRLLEETGDLQ